MVSARLWRLRRHARLAPAGNTPKHLMFGVSRSGFASAVSRFFAPVGVAGQTLVLLYSLRLRPMCALCLVGREISFCGGRFVFSQCSARQSRLFHEPKKAGHVAPPLYMYDIRNLLATTGIDHHAPQNNFALPGMPGKPVRQSFGFACGLSSV